MNLIKKITRILFSLFFFIFGNMIAFFLYERKYLRGKYFKNRYYGIGAVGWKWVCTSAPFQVFLGINKHVPWPVAPYNRIGDYKLISFDPDNMDNFQSFGIYFQALGAKLIIGKGTYIAPNVGLITQNHNVNNPEQYVTAKDIVIGCDCWIGMNAVILPGVILGPHTTVGAGAIVTKSFEDGHCVIAGNPARVIRKL